MRSSFSRDDWSQVLYNWDMQQVFLALGSNLGDRLENLSKAIFMLTADERILLVGKSSWFENPAVEGAGPNDFINVVIKVEASLPVESLFTLIQKIENVLGRVRTQSDTKEARTIDIDILTFGDVVLNTEELSIPHPRMLERDFVMKPLLEIEPEFVHPVKGALQLN